MQDGDVIVLCRGGATVRAEAADRTQAIRLLSCFTLTKSRNVFTELLRPGQPLAVQQAAVGALAEYAEPEAADLLLAHWPQYLPAVRANVLQSLLSRDTHVLAFLRAVEEGRVGAGQLDAVRRQQLVQHRNDEIRKVATRLLSAPSSRQAVIERYQPALTLPGAVARGRDVFGRACAACHQVNEKGQALGPNIASSAALDASALLVNILDPNRYLQPGYVMYVAEDVSGRSYAGMIAAETATSITLKRADNGTDTLLRRDLAKLSSLGISLMPEGLESAITPQEMADLLAFLRDAANPQSTPDENSRRIRDAGNKAGRIEPRKPAP